MRMHRVRKKRYGINAGLYVEFIADKWYSVDHYPTHAEIHHDLDIMYKKQHLADLGYIEHLPERASTDDDFYNGWDDLPPIGE